MNKLVLFLAVASFIPKGNAQNNITVDATVEFQTIEGWGHGGGILGGLAGPLNMLDLSVANPVNYQYLDYLADDLGLTGSRTWEVGPRIDGTGMDNGDCDEIDWTKFEGNSLSSENAAYLMYFRDKILAKGHQPSFYSSPGYPTHATDQKPWIVYHPGERAQQIWASAMYMRDTYGININYDVIYNEPAGIITSTILTDDIKALAPRLASHGLLTQSQYAEAVAPQNDWLFIAPVQNDDNLWPLVGRLSYHNYGTADPYRSQIYNFGLSKGISTAQTEMENPTFDELYADLTLGGVSYWEVGYSASATLTPNIGLTGFTPSASYIRLHQVIHYVTPGSVRIGTTSNNALLKVLAFKKNGFVTTVIDNTNTTNTAVTLSGIPAGIYGLSRAQPGAHSFEELGLQTVDASGTLGLLLNGGGWITTLYPYTGVNHAPDITTFNAEPGYLILPSNTATLSVSANDTELNPLTYQWTMVSSPAGSQPLFANSNAETTAVNGLNSAGTYVFNIDVTDGTNVSSKKVYLIVYSANPAPVLGSAGFRIAAPYGLVFANPGIATHANIELPISSVTLQVGISDLANSDFTGRGTWTLISQPAGASAVLGATTYIFTSIRASVSGMTVPGDYVFQVNVTNPGSADLVTQIICTVHPTSLPPVIQTIVATPSTVVLPATGTMLTATTSDPEGDLLRHWWALVSAPVGSNPTFDHQGLKVTSVNGLTVPGNYVFTLRCFDDLHMTTQNITVNVSQQLGIDGFSVNNPEISIYPNPFTAETTIHFEEEQQNTQMTILNLLGETLETKNIIGTQYTIKRGNMKPGMYLVQIKNKDYTIVKKIILQ